MYISSTSFVIYTKKAPRVIGTLAWRKVSKGHRDQNQLAIPTLALSRSGIRVSILWDTISAGQFQHPWFYEVNGYFSLKR